MANEKRLIDANALKDALRTNDGAKALGHSVHRLFCVDEIIDKAPTVDAVEVVRCKDCKHRGTDYCIFHINGEPADEELLKKVDEDFCSYGERKDKDA